MMLRELIRLWMRVEEVDLAHLAEAWGTSPSSVSRFLGGKAISMQTFGAILRWLLEGKEEQK